MAEEVKPTEPTKPTGDEPPHKPEPTKPKEKPAESVTDLIESAGINLNILKKVVEANEGELPTEYKDLFTEKHGKAIGDLIAKDVMSSYKEVRSKEEEGLKEVYSELEEAFAEITDQSGEESWKELQTWAKDNVEETDRKEINKLLKQGGIARKLALQELVTTFKESNDVQSNVQEQKAELIKGDKGSNSNIKPLTRYEYNREVEKLLKSGHSYETSPEIKKLQKRRVAGTKLGM